MTAELRAVFSKRFPNGPTITANLAMAANSFNVTVLFGPSGAGKTTVLRCIAGLEKPDSGSILLHNEVWFDAQSRRCWPPQRRGIGYMSQDYALFPHLTVAANIAFGLTGTDRANVHRRTSELVEFLGLRGLEARYPGKLSGGEQQRVVLARAVARRPRLLLLDEPLSALDLPTRERLRPELRGWLAEMQVPTLLVTHDLAEAVVLGHNLVVMDQGQMIQCGPSEEVLAKPASDAVSQIIGIARHTGLP